MMSPVAFLYTRREAVTSTISSGANPSSPAHRFPPLKRDGCGEMPVIDAVRHDVDLAGRAHVFRPIGQETRDDLYAIGAFEFRAKTA